jgi:hypothetical protein
MMAPRLLLFLIAVSTFVMLSIPIDHAAAQEVGLTPLQATKVAQTSVGGQRQARKDRNDKRLHLWQGR